MLEMKDWVWAERYRPKTLDEYICSLEFKEKIKNWISKNNSHLLFESSCPGSGKTSLAKIIADKVAGNEVLFLNSSMDTGIDTIREKVANFVSKKSMFGNMRVVIMDEADQISDKASDSLKSLIERFHSNARFIFTCNNILKISDPLKDRCEVVNFNSIHGEPGSISRKEAAVATLKLCERILTENEIKYDRIVLIQLVKRFLSDTFNLRSLIQFLYQNTRDSVLDEGALKKAVFELTEIFKHIKEKRFAPVREFIAIRYQYWQQIYTEIYNNVDVYFNIKSTKITALFEVLAFHQHMTVTSPNKEIPLCSLFSAISGLDIIK